MANETYVVATTKINPSSLTDVSIVDTGGTLTGSNVLELKILKSAFTTAEGKLRVLHALQKLERALIKAPWPLT